MGRTMQHAMQYGAQLSVLYSHAVSDVKVSLHHLHQVRSTPWHTSNLHSQVVVKISRRIPRTSSPPTFVPTLLSRLDATSTSARCRHDVAYSASPLPAPPLNLRAQAGIKQLLQLVVESRSRKHPMVKSNFCVSASTSIERLPSRAPPPPNHSTLARPEQSSIITS